MRLIKYFPSIVFVLSVIAVVISYYQPIHVTSILNTHYKSCFIQESGIDPLRCMRNVGSATDYFNIHFRPYLEASAFNVFLSINDLCVLIKDYLLLAIPLLIAGLYRSKIFPDAILNKLNQYRGEVKPINPHELEKYREIQYLFYDSLLLCVLWNPIYRYMISGIVRNMLKINVSGHIILIPLVLGYVISIIITYSNSSSSNYLNLCSLIFGIIFSISMLVHMVFTCLFFHTIQDIFMATLIVQLFSAGITYGMKDMMIDLSKLLYRNIFRK